MTDNRELVRNLTEKQKTELTADAATREIASNGIAVNFSDFQAMTEKTEGAYPSYKAIANCWNAELIKNLWRGISVNQRDESDVIISPHTGVCNSPYAGGLTEDPYLEGAYVNAFINGVKEGGLTPVVDCGFKVEDLWHMDEEFSDRAFFEYYALPYANLPFGTAFRFTDNKLSGEYSRINAVNLNNFLRDNNNEPTIFVSGADENTAEKYIDSGDILLNCETSCVKALAQSKGGAEKRDAACERAVNFALKVKADKEKSQAANLNASSVSPLEVAEQSCVLLKNNGVLPVKSGTRISVAGGFSYDVNAQELYNLFKQDGKFNVSWSEGFFYDEDISPALVKKAVDAASVSSYALLFLGFDDIDYTKAHSERCTTLPANMLALYYEVAACNKNVILVVNSDYYTDLSFATSAAAILLCPATGKQTLQAVFNIITGKTSPSGRLAQTRYADTDNNFCLLKNMRRSGAVKTGIFAGYRESNNKTILYPFGHGLSYTQFAYSDLFVTNDVVKFTLKNTGKMDAYEVVQVYVGKRGSPIVRPVKVLNGFVKIFLRAGESKICTVKILPETLRVFSEGKYLTEDGTYNIYIGASSADIRLKGTITVKGSALKSDGEKKSKYERSLSNIYNGGYAFGKVKITKVKGKRFLAAGFILLFVAILAALVGGAAHLAGYIDLLAFDNISIITLSAFAAVTLIAIILIIIGGIKFMASKKKGVVVTTGEAKGVELPQNPYERLFAELYGPDKYYYGENVKKAEKAEKADEPQNIAAAEEVVDNSVFIGKYDPSVTFLSECSRLNNFLADRGINAGIANTRCILASFAASRVVIPGGNLLGIEKVLPEFFGCDIYAANLTGVSDTSTLVNAQNDGTGIREALKHASENLDVIHIISIYGASDDEDIKAFKPFLKCAYADSDVNVVYQEGATDGSVIVPSNVWFFLVPDGERGICFTDKAVCDSSALLAVDCAPCDVAEQKTLDRTLNYYQYRRMLDKLINYGDEKYSLSEDHCWKKVDRLVRVLYNKCGYSLDNRNSLSIERYAAVYLACEGEQNNALDGAVACKIALSAASAMRNYTDEEENISSVVDSIFDEYENIQRVLNLYRRNAR